MTTRLLVGDVRDRIADIGDGTVDLVLTSPPFLALRKYGDDDAEMGSEGTPADFLDALLDLTQEFRRVLAPHGSIAIELGDTYSGSGGAGGDYGEGGWRAGQNKFAHRPHEQPGWPFAKSLALIPQLYPASLAYGRNLLRPDHTFAPWRVRNIITWCRPNPPVGALGDKVRPATSYITVACPSARRWFDLDAVRGPGSENTHARLAQGAEPRPTTGKRRDNPNNNYGTMDEVETAGAPPLDWWDDTLDPDDPTDHMTIVMPTQPYPGAHYATWPAKLAQRLIDMMCPRQVCTVCGRPSERIVEADPHYAAFRAGRNAEYAAGDRSKVGARDAAGSPGAWDNSGSDRIAMNAASYTTIGWSDCGHDSWRPGHVLDPFAGSGTTLAVAMGMGRDATGIELYPANADLIRERVGMFLEEVDGPSGSPPVVDVPGLDRFRVGYLRNDRPNRVPQTDGKVADR